MRRQWMVIATAAWMLTTMALSQWAIGQTDPGGLFAPWPKGQMTDGSASATFFDAGHAKGSDDDFKLSMYDSSGRIRLMDKFRINPTIGYSFHHLQLDGNSALPGQLVDAAIAFGTPITQFADNWFLALSGAVGYAGSSPFADGNAWYGRGTVLVGKELSRDSTLVFGLDYNGNRTLYPDIPLPGVAYALRLEEHLLTSVGFPYSTLTWQPNDQFRIDAFYTFPDLYELKVGYNITRTLQIFADIARNFSAYHDADLPGDRRLFFTQSRIEAGVRWGKNDGPALMAAIGYGFDQHFDIGFDGRDLDRVTRVSDEPYARVAFEWRY